MTPFVKTGGLADVVGALPAELKRLGHEVRVILPLHGPIDRARWGLRRLDGQLGVPLGYSERWCAVQEATLPGSNIPVYFIEHEQYFARASIYHHDGQDYPDNAERFAFFSRACCQLCKWLQFSPDVVHCHDWQTALVPVYLKTWEADHPLFWSTASVQTIHNVGYQGVFPKEEILHTQLGWRVFTVDGLEFYDQVNFLKGGVLYADKVSTVSPTHAKEIQTPEHGWGLDGVLRARSPDLVGILNGCDYDEWNPAHDRLLPAWYDVGDLGGKAICKQELQRRFHLPERPDVPLFGLVSRLAYQKGIDVLAEAMPDILKMDVQCVFLGQGEVWAHFVYGDMPVRYPGKAGAFVGFDDERAHLVYSGSDFFLMPSRYEPCGISQLAAMRYGSLPVVRATGGLEDTVENYQERTGAGDGFKFHDLTPDAITNTVGWAVSTYYDRPDHMSQMVQRAMTRRFLWSEAALQYEQLYHWAMERKRGF
jgi:starch synthase